MTSVLPSIELPLAANLGDPGFVSSNAATAVLPSATMTRGAYERELFVQVRNAGRHLFGLGLADCPAAGT